MLLNDMEDVMADASAFLEGTKVDRYNFIYLFFPQPSSGALEHSYSSVYVMIETNYSEGYRSSIRDIAAHEFFHTVTPLHIHSEIIEDFNFAVPTASQHLWLYEGVTEWASLMMQYRNGSKTLTRLLTHFKTKKDYADNPARNLSLTEMSLTSYTTGGSQFGNVYNRGALVAALLDIKLLELSNGTRGLREVMLELVDMYGPENAFPEADFFDVFVNMTYPEIEEFIELYIQGAAALPMKEYFGKIGIDFNSANNILTEIPEKTAAQQFLFDKWKVNL
jgi:predicted metalloprotease with PDZ domain